MDTDSKNRVESAVPKADGAERLSEEEMKSLELSGDIEHLHGRQREGAAKKATELSGSES